MVSGIIAMASSTGQRRRSHTEAQPSPPATWSASSSQAGTVPSLIRSSDRPKPKPAASRNAAVSTSQSRPLRGGPAAALPLTSGEPT
jgi:hypothetical protein